MAGKGDAPSNSCVLGGVDKHKDLVIGYITAAQQDFNNAVNEVGPSIKPACAVAIIKEATSTQRNAFIGSITEATTKGKVLGELGSVKAKAWWDTQPNPKLEAAKDLGSIRGYSQSYAHAHLDYLADVVSIAYAAQVINENGSGYFGAISGAIKAWANGGSVVVDSDVERHTFFEALNATRRASYFNDLDTVQQADLYVASCSACKGYMESTLGYTPGGDE